LAGVLARSLIRITLADMKHPLIICRGTAWVYCRIYRMINARIRLSKSRIRRNSSICCALPRHLEFDLMPCV
jgi:hypothetical protein